MGSRDAENPGPTPRRDRHGGAARRGARAAAEERGARGDEGRAREMAGGADEFHRHGVESRGGRRAGIDSRRDNAALRNRQTGDALRDNAATPSRARKPAPGLSRGGAFVRAGQRDRSYLARSSRNARRRKPLPLMAGLMLVAVVLGIALGMKALVGGGQTASQEPAAHTAKISLAEDAAVTRPATPTSQWRRGTLPWLYQTDSAWSEEEYAGATVRESGCGPTCLTMVYAWATGKTDMTPATMAAFSEQNGYVQDGKTAWALMSEGASKLGISATSLPLDAATVLRALHAGQPIIVSVRPGTFTTVGHFMVLGGVAADGSVILHDPNSASNSFKHWDVQQILDEANTAWTYTLS